MEENMISKDLEEKITAAETLEDVVKACAEEGIEVTKEQLEAGLAQIAQDEKCSDSEEMSEFELSSVSGGCATLPAYLAALYKVIQRRITPRIFK